MPKRKVSLSSEDVYGCAVVRRANPDIGTGFRGRPGAGSRRGCLLRGRRPRRSLRPLLSSSPPSLSPSVPPPASPGRQCAPPQASSRVNSGRGQCREGRRQRQAGGWAQEGSGDSLSAPRAADPRRSGRVCPRSAPRAGPLRAPQVSPGSGFDLHHLPPHS